jgi:hypothetical protein
MKKILKLSLVLAVVLTTMTTYANDNDFLLYVKSGQGKLISFTINGIQKVNLSIRDKEGKLIYSEKATGKGGVKRIYSLEEFPAGSYTLEAENDFKKIKYEIVITDEIAKISTKAISQVYKETIYTTKEKLVYN